MRMPEMDGRGCLRAVSERCPETVRVVLSGYSELQQIVRLVPYVAQYLAKHCEAPQLENLIDRCLQVQELLGQPTLRAVAGRIRKLPAMPRVYTQLRSMLADDSASGGGRRRGSRCGSRDRGEDPADRELRLLPFVAQNQQRPAGRHVSRVLDHSQSSTLRRALYAMAPVRGERQASILDRLQRHVHAVAGAAQALTANTPLADDALLAGLLHDIGYWVLAQECEPDLARSVRSPPSGRFPCPGGNRSHRRLARADRRLSARHLGSAVSGHRGRGAPP